MLGPLKIWKSNLTLPLKGLKDAIFSEEGTEYIKEGTALVKEIGALTETGLNTTGSESAQYSKHTTLRAGSCASVLEA